MRCRVSPASAALPAVAEPLWRRLSRCRACAQDNYLDWTPLHYSAYSNRNAKVTKFLLEHNADVNAQVSGGRHRPPAAVSIGVRRVFAAEVPIAGGGTRWAARR